MDRPEAREFLKGAFLLLRIRRIALVVSSGADQPQRPRLLRNRQPNLAMQQLR
jgi:hypothetical protein